MNSACALIVDDEVDLCDLVEISFQSLGIRTVKAHSLTEAKLALSQHTIDFCLTDMNLPDGTGIDWLDYLQLHAPLTPVAVITAYGNNELAVDCLRKGAFDFVSKPVDLSRLRALATQAVRLSQQQDKQLLLEQLVGDSSQITELKHQVERAARSQAPILIQGESGTGKEIVARLIHQLGGRQQSPFIAVNCGAIPQELMESEFFGHKKGSFTGAHEDKQGFFQAAHGGTLFLDEVGDLPLNLQVKLLRVIQERKVKPVGAQQEVQTDVRIISASHKSLEQLSQNGNFRQDLFFRINVITLAIPPLRDRLQDLSALTQHILAKLCLRYQCGPRVLSPRSESLLRGYNFPGNVRELENLIEKSLALSEGSQLDIELPRPVVTPSTDAVAGVEQSQPQPSQHQLPPGKSLEAYIEDVERDIIIGELERQRWNRTKTAEVLGITFRALRYRLKKLGID